MNKIFEEHLKDLSPELQEKARECETMEELNDFLAENEIELPDDVLDAVAGGGGCDEKCYGSDDRKHNWYLSDIFEASGGKSQYRYVCRNCGNSKYETK